MVERNHLSIGEVLSLLQEEFPDVTISKIRFLESQGLLDPERTPSGYRKFYDGDIDRLRWILRQQRENFLPLRVIKDRLEDSVRTGRPLTDVTTAGYGGEPAVAVADTEIAVGALVTDPVEAPVAVPSAPAPAAAPAKEASMSTVAKPAPSAAARSVLDAGPTSVSLTRDELVAATGLTEKALGELERYGLLSGRPMGRETLYDEEALVVARLAAGFLRFGVEARHLRMYKVAAEREAGFLEQVVLPLLKQRNPSARQRAVDTLGELVALGEALRAAMLRQSLKGFAGPN